MKGEYFFKKNDKMNCVQCILQLNDSLAFDEMDALLRSIASDHADVEKERIVFSFYTEYCLNRFDKFQSILQKAGFVEKYTNKTSYEFYKSQGKEILVQENYPLLIKEYLQYESQQVSKIITAHQSYTALLEVACADARNMDIALKNNLKYYGIDFIRENIDKAEKRIKALNQISTAFVECASIFDLSEKKDFIPETEKVLTFFPFNALGNMGSIISVLKIVLNLNYDIVFSIFKTTDEANRTRFEYYQNCGYSNLKCYDDGNGIIFTSSEGLKSIAYFEHYLKTLFETLNCRVTLISDSGVGALYYLQASLIPSW
ncbi:MAG: hypothetical protein K0Q74_260 [Gammaproteobacteria bacterium]|jgi:hypothetical protein|nr:hypothetical protein [Gammaproteobacteria bacterium]